MKKFLLSFACCALILAAASMAWLYQTRPEVLLNSTVGKIISPFSFGNAVAVRDSSVVLAQAQAKGLLASGAYDGRIIYSVNDANYTAAGLQWPWNNIIEIVNVNKGQMKRDSHAVFRNKYDFAFFPQWLSNGKVLFSVGEIGSYGIYDFVEWNPTTWGVQPIAKDLASGPVIRSPGGRFTAYIEGGRSYPVGPTDPQFLRVRDMETDKIVGKSLGLNNFSQIVWLSSDVLLFNMSKPATRRDLPDSNAIWQINPLSGKSKIFRKDAFTGQVSPDGKWFTCLSYDNPATKQVERALPISAYRNPATKLPPLYLVLSSADQRIMRTVTDQLPSFQPEIIWTADSKRFAIYEASRRNFGRSSKPAEDIVRIYDVKSKALRRIGKVQRSPQKLLSDNTDSVFCTPLDFTKDQRFLIFVIRNLDGKFAGTTLVAFNTKSGATQTWFYTSAGGSTSGLSWLEN